MKKMIAVVLLVICGCEKGSPPPPPKETCSLSVNIKDDGSASITLNMQTGAKTPQEAIQKAIVALKQQEVKPELPEEPKP